MQKITSPIQLAILQAIKNHFDLELIVAYSGGVDSQVLLHALAQLKKHHLIHNAISVCHVNHGLSANALKWQEFAKIQCDKLSVHLVVKKVNIQSKAQQSLEALARDARYDALKSLNQKKSLILTGHHSDDQSETFLLALKRGSGLKGLSAMEAESNLEQHLLVRPLLTFSRQQIVDYAIENKLEWVEDESNSDTSFDRNFIRQTLMPLMKKRWPSISNTINRSASHCLAGQELLNEMAEQDLSTCLVDSKAHQLGLRLDSLTLLSHARFNNLIRYYLSLTHCMMPSTAQINQLQFQLTANDDKTPEVKVGNHYFRRYKKSLFLTPQLNDISRWTEEINLLKSDCVLSLPDQLGDLNFSRESKNSSYITSTEIRLPKKDQVVTVRFRHENPKCLPDYRQHSRSLKKVLQELDIAPWERKRIPFLYYDNELVSAIGYFVCQPFIPEGAQDKLFITSNR